MHSQEEGLVSIQRRCDPPQVPVLGGPGGTGEAGQDGESQKWREDGVSLEEPPSSGKEGPEIRKCQS